MRLIDAEDLYLNVITSQSNNPHNEPMQRAMHKHEHEHFLVMIGNSPTIDPASLRPKGEWKMRGGKLYCSHCGERAGVARDTEDFWYTKGTDACPNCGADMRGNPHDS